METGIPVIISHPPPDLSSSQDDRQPGHKEK